MRLTGMEQADALTLIGDEAKKKGVTLNDDEARRLFARTGGVPLAIVWSVAQMGFGYGIEAVLTRLGQPTGDIARFCFEGAVERLKGKPAYKLLLALSLFATDASREALGYVADLPELDRDEGLVELEKLSLVNKRGGRFELLPLTLTYCKAQLTKDIVLETALRDRWVEFFLNFLIRWSQRRYDSLQDVNPEISNILKAMDWCWNMNRLETFIALTERMDFYLWVTGNWNTHTNYMDLGLKAAILLGAELDQANFLRHLASMKDFQDDLDEAQNLVKKAIEIYKLHDNKAKLAVSIWRLASIQIKCGEYETARNNLDEAMAIAKEFDDQRLIARIQRRLAEIDMIKGNYSSAENRLKQAQELRELQLREQDTELSSGVAYTYRLLGRVSLLQQNYKLANQYFQHSLGMAQKIGSQHNIAEAKQYLAELSLTLGHIDQAQKFAQEAIDTFTKLGMKRQLRETQTLLARIEQVNHEGAN